MYHFQQIFNPFTQILDRCFFWYWLTRVVPDKIHIAAKWYSSKFLVFCNVWFLMNSIVYGRHVSVSIVPWPMLAFNDHFSRWIRQFEGSAGSPLNHWNEGFHGLDVLPVIEPSVSRHWRERKEAPTVAWPSTSLVIFFWLTCSLVT